MCNFTTTNSNPDLAFLLCGALTLEPSNNFFKRLVLKPNIFVQNKTSTLQKDFQNSKELKEFSTIINCCSIRKVAYLIIRPFILKINTPNSYSDDTQTLTLKKYLKKFNYFYRRYFLDRIENNHTTPTNKQINYYALKVLFLLAGV